MKKQTAIFALLVALLAAGAAQAQPQKTLKKCAVTASKEVVKFQGGYVKSISKCMDKIGKEILEVNAASVAGAASACASSLRKLYNTEDPTKTLAAKMQAKIEKACDPAINTGLLHSTADVISLTPTLPEGIQAKELDAWCVNFDGDGSIDSIQEWSACQTRSAICQALHQVVVQYPRLLEWLDAIRPEIAALGGDPKYTDAFAMAFGLYLVLDADQNGEVDLTCGP